MKQIRQSNMELLRIICMFMIVMHHFATSVWFPGLAHVHTPCSAAETIVLLLHGLIFIGVNCFVFISGYFGIKTSLRGFIHLYGFYAFYAFLIALSQYFGDAQYAGMPLTTKWFHIIVHSLMPWDNNNFWFLNAYLGLFMMAPLLNAAIANLPKVAYMRILVLLTILNVIFGNFFSIDLLNTWGFSVAQFVYLYMIGGFIHNHVSLESVKVHRWHHFGLYICSALIWGALVAVQVFKFPYLGRFFKAFSYNNILILTAAIGFFLFMLSFDIKSSAINWLATSCLAAYLLQGSIVPFSWYIKVLDKFTYLNNLLYLLISSVLFLMLALLFDKLRRFVTKPLSRICKTYVPKLQAKINSFYERWQ